MVVVMVPGACSSHAGTVYLSVTVVLSGMVNFVTIADVAAPISFAFQSVGLSWATHVINVVCESVLGGAEPFSGHT